MNGNLTLNRTETASRDRTRKAAMKILLFDRRKKRDFATFNRLVDRERSHRRERTRE